MTPKEIAKHKANAELMVIDSLQNFERVTGLSIHNIIFEQKTEDGKTTFSKVTFHLENDIAN